MGLLFLLSFMILLADSCKVDENYITPPVVSISSPFNKQIFGYGDTIYVKVGIIHFRNISSVKVSVLNDVQSPVLPVLNFEVNDLEFQLITYFVVDDIALSSGDYFLQIRIQDTEYSWNEGVDIQIAEEDKKLLSLIAVTTDQINAYKTFEIPLHDSISELFSFQGDFLGSSIYHARNLFYTAGSVYHGLTAWDLNTKRLVWNVPAVVNPPQPWLYSFYADEKEVFVSNREGYITGYDTEGRVTFRSEKNENGVFRKMIRHQSKLIAVNEPYNHQFSEIVVFNYPGGTVFRSLQISGQVVHLAWFSDKKILVFVNEQGSAASYEFSVDDLSYVKLKTFSFDRMQQVINAGFDRYFILSGNEIWWYRSDIASATDFLHVFPPVFMAIDEVNNELFVASGKTVTNFRLPFSQAVRSWELPSEIISLNLRYNR